MLYLVFGFCEGIDGSLDIIDRLVQSALLRQRRELLADGFHCGRGEKLCLVTMRTRWNSAGLQSVTPGQSWLVCGGVAELKSAESCVMLEVYLMRSEPCMCSWSISPQLPDDDVGPRQGSQATISRISHIAGSILSHSHALPNMKLKSSLPLLKSSTLHSTAVCTSSSAAMNHFSITGQDSYSAKSRDDSAIAHKQRRR